MDPYKTDKDEWFFLDTPPSEFYFWRMYLHPGHGLWYQIVDKGKVIGEGSTPWDARINAGIQDA